METKIASIGECMLELSSLTPSLGIHSPRQLSYGGDSLNVAVYLARHGAEVDYFTAVGDDTYSESMLASWQQLGVGTQQVYIAPGRMPGLYAIETDSSGERSFFYWRDSSPARELIRLVGEDRLFAQLMLYPYLYLSGITLSLYDQATQLALFDFLKSYREQGGVVIFDSNYRPRAWQCQTQAQTCFAQMLRLCDIALPSFDDEQLLWGKHSLDQCLARHVDAGINEIVVKNGAAGCTLWQQGKQSFHPAQPISNVVDTTAAGDSFNGAYLAARIQQQAAAQAIEQAQHCAAQVIQQPGAIVDIKLFEQGEADE